MTAALTAPTSSVKSSLITNLDASPIVRAGVFAGGAFGRLMRMQASVVPSATAATSVLHRLVRIPSNCIVQDVWLLLDTGGSQADDGMIVNCGLWWSDSTNDGTSVINQGNLTAISAGFFCTNLDISTFVPVLSSYTSNDGSMTITSPSDAEVAASVQIGQTFVPITFANVGSSNGSGYVDGGYGPSQSVNPIWQAVSNILALQSAPTGAGTSTTQTNIFNTAVGSTYVWSQDPGGFFDICLQFRATGVNANTKVSLRADILAP